MVLQINSKYPIIKPPIFKLKQPHKLSKNAMIATKKQIRNDTINKVSLAEFKGKREIIKL